MDSMDSCEYPLDELVEVMARLRAPDGCPWDRKQTRQSLKPYLLEETYEVLQAIDEGKMYKLCEELGDLLLQVIFHAQLASEQGEFDINDVTRGIVEKLVRRHPHVFGNVEVEGADEVLVNWEAIKKQERQQNRGAVEEAEAVSDDSLLSGVPRELPALTRSYVLQSRAARVGFDWPEVGPVVHKVFEEARELKAAWHSHETAAMEREFGDLLFALVNLARFLDVRPEFALNGANSRFESRFRYIERRAAKLGENPNQMTLEQLDELWDEAKLHEK